jgi:hypothetical protein
MLAFLAVQTAIVLAAGGDKPWMVKSDPPEKRAATLLTQMNFTEKLAMLHGPIAPMPCCECRANGTITHRECAYTGNVVPNHRLGIPSINMNDVGWSRLHHVLCIRLMRV